MLRMNERLELPSAFGRPFRKPIWFFQRLLKNFHQEFFLRAHRLTFQSSGFAHITNSSKIDRCREVLLSHSS
ncbi:uncharacterized protein METZ01_LOCUS354080 [marine metagenome]|uniref:Uncharacterized protein n=1 Tax=marine metagenome TaxID=408172 RepID=A0A382RU95_9ZZZZ